MKAEIFHTPFLSNTLASVEAYIEGKDLYDRIISLTVVWDSTKELWVATLTINK